MMNTEWMKTCAVTTAALAIMMAVGCGDGGPDGPDRFLVGYAQTDISPPDGTVMGGYGVPGMNRITEGVHDRLLAQAALFTNDDGEALLLISADLAGYMWDFGDWGPGIKELRKSIVSAVAPGLVLTPEQIVIASSHSHGAADLMGFSQAIGEGPDVDLLAATTEKITAMAVEAAADLKPRTVLFGSTSLEGVSARDKDCSPVLDTEVGVIQVREETGEVVVTIANFAKHPTIAPESNRLATADFVWGYREEMRQATGAPAMYFQGFEAAVHGLYSFYDEEDFWDKVYEVGGMLAHAVIEIQPTLEPADSFEIRNAEKTYACTGSESYMADAVQYLQMPKRFLELNDDGSVTVDELPLSWHRLGPAQFIAFPGEPSPEYSQMAKSLMASRFRFALGLANDATGYIVEPESATNDTTGQLAGYEVRMGLGLNAGVCAWEAANYLFVNSPWGLEDAESGLE